MSGIRRIRRLLIANRGEIACRIIKTAREMGIHTVAVFSQADAASPHVRLADESYLIGPPPSAESYLRKEKILDVAKHSKVDAIHPGYGFLSENAEFADMVADEGIIFIGPSGNSMHIMGDKVSARKMARDIHIPMVEGVLEPLADVSATAAAARSIGFPILIKASAGGGGKGMRTVHSESELESAFNLARSEAKASFGDDRVYIEKYLENPRHIEVQILADSHNNVIHLGERECSIQRRHQKIVEESPSVALDPDLRSRITDAAVRLVYQSGYVNAGTLEFLIDARKNFYFLEMNTRLQVEHPVTEMRTGIDIVREQIRIAEGLPLGIAQADVPFNGATVECRIYAEDSFNNFFPSTGVIHSLRLSPGSHTREDRGIEEGGEITTYYDPMISKVITWGENREEALNRMSRTLNDYEIYGIRTNVSLCRWIVDHPKFREGDFSTGFLSTYFSPDKLPSPDEDELLFVALGAVLESTTARQTTIPSADGSRNSTSKWKSKRLDSFS